MAVKRKATRKTKAKRTKRKGPATRSKRTPWLAALAEAKLEVKSARDTLRVREWLDTGNYALNWAISGRLLGGWPMGHTGEIFGDPGTGKSFLAIRAMAMAQAAGGVALLDDSEGAYVGEFMEKMGINLNKLALVRSQTVEEHGTVTKAFAQSVEKLGIRKPCIEVLDSIAALSTKHELEAEDKRDMTKAPALKKFYRIHAPMFFDLPAFHLATNHKIANIGNPWRPTTTGGGGGPKYQASVRVDLRTTSKIKGQGDYDGVIVRAFVDKNRFVAPWKEVQLAIPFKTTIERTSGLCQVLVSLGVFTVKGERQSKSIYYGDEKLGRWYTTNEKFLQQDDVAKRLIEMYPQLLPEVDKWLVQQKPSTEPTVEEVVPKPEIENGGDDEE